MAPTVETVAESDMAAPSMPAGFPDHTDFRVGDVISLTITMAGRQFPAYVGIMAIVTALSLYTMPTVGGLPLDGLLAPESPRMGRSLFQLILGVASLIAQLTVMDAVFSDLCGRPVDFSAAWQRALRRFFPVLGTTFLLSFAVLLGFLLLIIPGIMIFVALAVAFPAVLIEDLGPFRGLQRSRELTKSHRWAIFGIYLVLGIAGFGIIGLIGAVVNSLFGQAAGIGSDFILKSLVGAYGSAFVAVLYYQLRVAKEGSATSRIVSVFD
jgi:hypothetical protein